jgi:hypothetical protein
MSARILGLTASMELMLTGNAEGHRREYVRFNELPSSCAEY